MREEVGERSLVAGLLREYQSLGGKGSEESDEWLAEVSGRLAGFLSADFTCLICLERIDEKVAIWSCQRCFEPFHMACLQGWARQAMAEISLAEETTPKKEPVWACPKCRKEYSEKEMPKRYFCYCGKVREPKPEPWTPAHTCGDVCGRSLGACGHSCLCLCHPGPCPPCPKILKSACFCGAKAAKPLRCGKGGWSCGERCKKRLDCGRHRCERECHAGACEPCQLSSERSCRCGRATEERRCAEGDWSCGKVCDKALAPCGQHRCEEICHSGPCGPCVAGGAGANRCPCGKREYPGGSGCRAQLPLCGDTCEKVLDCGFHVCIQRCHRGPCPPCRERRTKRCRCGGREKEVACGKPFLCDVKCRRLRDCGRHNCNRKCCDGECPPCTTVCGERLRCGSHRCEAPCHRGPCYPCPRIRSLACGCGRTSVGVPCGAGKAMRPPKCPLQCPQPPPCHHAKAEPHLCHFGPCPPCLQPCGKDHPSGCGHQCSQSCHSAQLEDVNAGKGGATPWETPKADFQRVSRPCPPCPVPVHRSCRGGHETATFPCAEDREFSCERECGRLLPCGNHRCRLACHGAEQDCEESCERMCSLERALDCSHACPKACHPPPCPPCPQMVKETCHCGLNPIYTPCAELSQRSVESLSCGNQCPRELSCGHSCTLTCHPKGSPCSPVEDCKRKVPITCACRRLSAKRRCGDRAAASLACDEECERVAEENRRVLLTQQSSLASSTASTEREELPSGELQPRRRRKRKEQIQEVEEQNFLRRHSKPIIAAFVALIAFLVLAYGLFRP